MKSSNPKMNMMCQTSPFSPVPLLPLGPAWFSLLDHGLKDECGEK